MINTNEFKESLGFLNYSSISKKNSKNLQKDLKISPKQLMDPMSTNATLDGIFFSLWKDIF
jgi:hypothetical protein